jgi:hypothetical protein
MTWPFKRDLRLRIVETRPSPTIGGEFQFRVACQTCLNVTDFYRLNPETSYVKIVCTRCGERAEQDDLFKVYREWLRSEYRMRFGSQMEKP